MGGSSGRRKGKAKAEDSATVSIHSSGSRQHGLFRLYSKEGSEELAQCMMSNTRQALAVFLKNGGNFLMQPGSRLSSAKVLV